MLKNINDNPLRSLQITQHYHFKEENLLCLLSKNIKWQSPKQKLSFIKQAIIIYTDLLQYYSALSQNEQNVHK